LKTLEEPPAHVKFIFATTEPNKILPTIISRCQRFDLRPIPVETIARQLQHIADAENVTLNESAAWSIAKGAEGGMRDAQSMLDQLVAFCGETITEENVQSIFGFTSSETISTLASSIFRRNTAESISLIQTESAKGKDLTQLLSDLADFIRALLISRLNPDSADAEIPSDFWEELGEHAEKLGDDRLLAVLDRLADADIRMRRASNKQLHFEIALIRATQSLDEVRISDVVRALETATDEGNPPATLEREAAPHPAPENQATPPDESERPPPPRRTSSRALKKGRGVETQLESLIEQAPEKRAEPPEPAQSESTPPSSDPEPNTTGETPPVESVTEDAFYDDPLVHDALRIFKGKLKE
ncbi:MAG: DNA polymerase III subunit gamma/tau, partial [Verrucomicrobiota bacterium]|nr:DNA polymerase III subunit gamma/tau [Verrucomicrobiota bacterium]